MMVAIQWKRLSPLGAAEQWGGGSALSSDISLCIHFLEADTEVVETHVPPAAVAFVEDEDDLPPPIIFVIFPRSSFCCNKGNI
ncbi:hypothetical protein F3Y22_tig00111708pilonHSYRG00405 [Hibiscus syriacus]|uniref:Uncharacterized protein n=1 Tax=Hibiscus syriacus TaxID=106335 RepID=A0A6A2YI93_HIBSY|nr:hypothetical protein F3Y22_tig00111708pilonHSYRG00405 [Hibiscus syriacus]